jgi:hypothetical protein
MAALWSAPAPTNRQSPSRQTSIGRASRMGRPVCFGVPPTAGRLAWGAALRRPRQRLSDSRFGCRVIVVELKKTRLFRLMPAQRGEVEAIAPARTRARMKRAAMSVTHPHPFTPLAHAHDKFGHEESVIVPGIIIAAGADDSARRPDPGCPRLRRRHSPAPRR